MSMLVDHEGQKGESDLLGLTLKIVVRLNLVTRMNTQVL